MLSSIILGLSLYFQSPPPAPAPPSHSVADRTGIEWVFPFESALEKAKRESRILMVKPIAFGTTRDGGW